MLASSVWPLRTDMPLVCTMSRKSATPLSSPSLSDRREPGRVVGLDRKPALPARVPELFVGLRHLVGADQIGVVGGGEKVEVDADIFAVRLQRLRHHGGGQRRLHGIQQLFAMQRLQRRRAGVIGVGRTAAGAALVERALHDRLGAAAPDLDVDAVFLLEGVDDGRRVVRHQRSVVADRAFLLGALDQPRRAVGALIGGDLGERARLRRCWRGGERNRHAEQQRYAAITVTRASIFAHCGTAFLAGSCSHNGLNNGRNRFWQDEGRQMTEALRRKLTNAGRVLTSQDQGDFVAGHVTVRLPDDPGRFLMKPATIGLEEMTPDNIITVDLDGQKVGGTMPRHNEVFIHSGGVARAPGHPGRHPYPCAARGRVLLARARAGAGQQRGRLFLQAAAGVLRDHRPHRHAGARQGGGALPRPEQRGAPAQPRHRHGRAQHRGGGVDRAQARTRLPRAAHGRMGGRSQIRRRRRGSGEEEQRGNRGDLYTNVFNYLVRIWCRDHGKADDPCCHEHYEQDESAYALSRAHHRSAFSKMASC